MRLASEIPTTVADNGVTSKRLKLKILVKKPADGACKISEVPEVNCVKKAPSAVGGNKIDAGDKVNCVKKIPSADGRGKADAGRENLRSTFGTKHMIKACQSSKQVPKVDCLEKLSNDNQITTAFCDEKHNPIAGCKRKSEEVLENHERKRLKMDASATLTCRNILKKLINLKRSAPFHAPVEPELWGLDDYFDIIKKPMDLGTIQQKLQQNKYVSAEQFDADVRLTFSNAMLYNPPANWYHKTAKELLSVYDRLWKPFKIKLDREHRDMEQKGSENNHGKIASDVEDKDQSVSTDHIQLPRKPVLLKAKSADDSKTPSLEAKHNDLKTVTDGEPKHKQKPKYFISSKTQSDISVSESQSACPMQAKVCENAPKRKIGHGDDNSVKVKSISPSQRGSHGQDFNREYHGFARCQTTDFLGATVNPAELSPSRALRVAKLLDRFSETILKAQDHTLLEQVSGSCGTDVAVWQREKLMLQMRQREEKARIEAQIKAVQSAARLKTDSELKKQRQAEREAARIALQRMERSVFVDDNFQVLKDLETMIGCPLVFMCHGDRSCANTVWSRMKSDKLKSPLERLGLYIKEEYQIGNENDYIVSMDEELEDGEVVC